MEAATQPEAGNDNGVDTRSQKEGRVVEKTLVNVFNDEAKAYGASHALEGLEQHGDVTWTSLQLLSSGQTEAFARKTLDVSAD
jgi:hypothetical protein